MTNHLLLVTEMNDERGGIAGVNRALYRNLKSFSQERGENLVVLSLHDGETNLESAGVTFRQFSGRSWLFAMVAVRYGLTAKVIVTGHVRLAIPFLALPWLLANLVIFGHGSEVTNRMKRGTPDLLRKAGLVMANSNRTANRITQNLPDCEVVACQLGLNEGSKKTESTSVSLKNVAGDSVTLGEKVLLLVGRMDSGEREKGHHQVLSALQIVVKQHPDAQLVFAGGGDDWRRYVEQAEAAGLAFCVFIPGALDRAILNQLFSNCFVYVMPSQQEGFGLVYLEAMDQAKPCIGCRNDGAEEIIDHEVTGILVSDKQDPQEIAEAVLLLLDNLELALSMGQAGKQRLEQEFTAAGFDRRFRQHMSSFL